MHCGLWVGLDLHPATLVRVSELPHTANAGFLSNLPCAGGGVWPAFGGLLSRCFGWGWVFFGFSLWRLGFVRLELGKTGASISWQL